MTHLQVEKWSTGYILGVIFIITPIYQVLLLMYAALFGKFKYFLDKQKKLLQLVTNLIRKRNQER